MIFDFGSKPNSSLKGTDGSLGSPKNELNTLATKKTTKTSASPENIATGISDIRSLLRFLGRIFKRRIIYFDDLLLINILR